MPLDPILAEQKLSQLSPVQMNRLIMRLRLDVSLIPSSDAPPAARAIEVVKLLQAYGRLDDLTSALEQITNPLSEDNHGSTSDSSSGWLNLRINLRWLKLSLTIGLLVLLLVGAAWGLGWIGPGSTPQPKAPRPVESDIVGDVWEEVAPHLGDDVSAEEDVVSVDVPVDEETSPAPVEGMAAPVERMVHVAEGPFTRGSDSGKANEKPVRSIWLSEFWIDTYEVTTEAYAVCVRAGKCDAPKTSGAGCNGELNNWSGSGPRSGRERHPVNCVDWNQAAVYCAWRGDKYRLPTEAEWEKAARWTDGREYPWGNAPASCQYAVMADGGSGCGKGSTWEVGSKPDGKSPYGVHDMSGNVLEWVSDWYDSSYYSHEASPERDPEGPKSGSDRVLRGGSWDNDGDGLRAANRYRNAPSDAAAFLGFRCAKVR